MSTDSRNRMYGGLVFAYSDADVRLWAPDENDDFATGRIILVKEGWGNTNQQASTGAFVSRTK